MKFYPYFSLALGILALTLAPGCAGLFQSAPNVNPASWAPQLPTGAGVAASSGSRPLRQDDTVNVTVRAGSVDPFIVQDVVDAYGNSTLPHVGEFRVGQLTTSEAEQAIRDSYIKKGFFTSPEVTLTCPNMIQATEYFVTGAIQKKGSFPFRDGITLWQAIVAAGDVSDFASSKVKLVRNGVAEEYDIRKIKSGKSKNPLLMPGDMIEVLESWL